MSTEANTPNKSLGVRIALLIFVLVAVSIAVILVSYRRDTGMIPQGSMIDRIVVEKSARKLSVFRQGQEMKSYRIGLGRHPVGAKQEEGDMKTPEGLFTIDYRNPQSDYHLALHVSYPRPEDVSQATARGVSAGCDIMIHGLPNGQEAMAKIYKEKDWTEGCIALTNDEIEELWRITPDGTPIEIRP